MLPKTYWSFNPTKFQNTKKRVASSPVWNMNMDMDMNIFYLQKPDDLSLKDIKNL